MNFLRLTAGWRQWGWLLRVFSAFGLLTVLSGFLLFWISSK